MRINTPTTTSSPESTVQAYPRSDTHEVALLILRVTLGALLLLHGIGKLSGGLQFVQGVVASVGLPSVLAYGVLAGEVIAPLLLIVGLWTRAAALVVVINMLVAVALVHGGDFARLTPNGGWALELQAFYLTVALAVALVGAGRYSVGGVNGRWN